MAVATVAPTVAASLNTTETRKASAAFENSRTNTPEIILSRAMNAMLRAKGGRFSMLNDNEITTLTEMFCGAIVAQGWRIHKDYPVCTECRKPVQVRAMEAKHWGETEGAAKSAEIRQAWQAKILFESE